jgi:hypothetical protein
MLQNPKTGSVMSSKKLRAEMQASTTDVLREIISSNHRPYGNVAFHKQCGRAGGPVYSQGVRSLEGGLWGGASR